MNRTVVMLVVASCVACSTATGCSSARYVTRQSDSGVVAIPANTNSWPFHYRQSGEELIRQHVGSDFEIVDEREVVTGSRVMNDQQTQSELTPNKKQPNMPGARVTSSGTTTSSNVTEWQISYRRRAAGAATLGAAPGTQGAFQPIGGTAPVRP